MARRIRWQILIAAISSLTVLLLMSYLALTRASVARPLTGGDYVEGVVGAPLHLNPLLVDPAADPVAADLHRLIFEGLTRPGPDGLPMPALAESWTVDDSGTVYTFTLRSGVAWHDGAPVTVDDVLFTMRAVQGPAFAGDQNVAAFWRTVLVDRAGERSVSFRLDSPFAPFLRLTGFPILPAHLLRDTPPEQWEAMAFNRLPVGAGPYRLIERDDQHALLRANSSYFGSPPFIETIELRFFRTEQDALAALTRGDIQGLAFLSTGALADVNLPRNVVRRQALLDACTVLTFNLRDGPLTEIGVRRALAMALDKDALIAGVLNGQVARLDTPILHGWWAEAPDVQWYEPDPARAVSALDALGYVAGADGIRARNGQRLAFTLLTDSSPKRRAVAEEIARQWSAIGVRIVIEQVESGDLQRRLETHDFTMALHGWQRLGSDPDVFELWHSSQAERGRNYTGLTDADIDELLYNARKIYDIADRAALYNEFQQRWVDLAPGIMLYQPFLIHATVADLGSIIAVAPDEAVSPRLIMGREGRFADVNRWYLRSDREIRGDLR
ncbi:peptide ABC transporter substrate-binding protein [Roseiflexus castenholzii]|uniref:Extracellular solute-binding protein family 5 n=1 Tax=Roseiflexus castenholzii (strain DSM 13941 / HLO8) TaxID=383372 RepID=A7NG66_ROSCS|nr:peptide ABC transporter substrate-binding protein [Roseiflexus castenholzii]ABU56453.1 extracellular solute-binding protein family 5 [Roseiflexus castenholzii DSM 13941]